MVDLTDKVFNPELALEIYQSVKARASKDNIHLVDFAAALITCSKVILREELGEAAFEEEEQVKTVARRLRARSSAPETLRCGLATRRAKCRSKRQPAPPSELNLRVSTPKRLKREL